MERLAELTKKQLTAIRADDFVRFLGLAAKFAGDRNAYDIALRNFPVAYPRSLHADLFQKAAVQAATTLDATWAGPLSAVKPIRDAFLEMVRPRTLLGRIAGLKQVPQQSTLPLQTGGGSYAWIPDCPKMASPRAWA